MALFRVKSPTLASRMWHFCRSPVRLLLEKSGTFEGEKRSAVGLGGRFLASKPHKSGVLMSRMGENSNSFPETFILRFGTVFYHFHGELSPTRILAALFWGKYVKQHFGKTPFQLRQNNVWQHIEWHLFQGHRIKTSCSSRLLRSSSCETLTKNVDGKLAQIDLFA